MTTSRLDEVTDVHDLHVWTLTSEMHVLTAHLTVDAVEHTQAVLAAAQTMLAAEFGLTHATLQVEVGANQSCDEMTW